MEVYTHPQEEWDEKKCRFIAKRYVRDGLGTKMHRPGYIPNPYGTSQTYNGGVIREGKWYQAEAWPLPNIPDGFEFEYVSTWGYFLKAKA